LGTVILSASNSYGGDTLVTQGTLQVDAPLTGSGGTVRLSSYPSSSTTLIANASIGHSIFGAPVTRIVAELTDISLGDSNDLSGFLHAGTMRIGANSVTLRSRAFAALGTLTTLGGGTLAAPNGVLVSPGGVFAGSGAVNGKVSAGIGSTIEATGDLALGSAGDFDGFFSDGVLNVGRHRVTIHDRNDAVLGSLTTVGAEGNRGTLAVPNGSLLEGGKNLVGYGDIEGELINRGAVHGEGPAQGDGIRFHHRVTGDGSFSGNVEFLGQFAPGNSPAIVSAENVRFGERARLEIELGGRAVGEDYDVLAATGEVWLQGTLRVELVRGFRPSPGDEFTILTYPARTGGFDAFEGAELGDGLYLGRLFGASALTLVTALGGDLNLDGTVNRADLAMFSHGYSAGGDVDWANGDFNGDGYVRIDDLLILKRNYGRSVAMAAPVPEPAAFWMAAVLVGFALVQRGRSDARGRFRDL
jgi:autotransporter-associated beta strand protein